MLQSPISLSVNEDGAGTMVTHTLERHETPNQNRSVFISDSHTLKMRDKIDFYRSYPKPSGNFAGVRKLSCKYTTDYVVEGVDQSTTLIAPSIIEVNFSFPIGMTEAERILQKYKIVALLQNSEFTDFVEKLSL